MTHGTNFAVLPDLSAAFNEGVARALKVRLQDEQFHLAGRLEAAGGGEFRGLLEGRSLRLRGVIGDLGHL